MRRFKGGITSLLACIAAVVLCSRAAVLGQCTPPMIVQHPNSVQACPGNVVPFHVNAIGTGLMFQWQLSTDGGTIWTPIPAAITPTYNRSVVNDDNGYKFRCVVTGTCGMAISNPATLSIPVIYVNSFASGANNGTSWFNAFVNLEVALATAGSNTTACDQIWVAMGTYLPNQLTDPQDPRSASFRLIDKVAVYGGFVGGEVRLNQHLPAVNVTTLTHNPFNSRYVVTASTTDSALLDGFTISAASHQPPECVAEFYVNGGAAASRDQFSTLQVITERDRYLDLDPNPTAPLPARPILSNNTQKVSVDQSFPPAQGALLEVASQDSDCGICGCGVGCLPGAYQIPAPPACGPLTSGYCDPMALNELNILPGTRGTLANRAGFAFGTPEAMYVRTLRLFPNSILNTNNQRLYFDQLVDENNAPLNPVGPNPNGSMIINVPLPGYSLGVIGMNDPAEFNCRVRTRIHDDPNNPGSPAGSIQRIDVPLPPSGIEGVMDMQTLAAQSVSAKGAFARSGTDALTVSFEYRFLGAPPGTRLIVKIGDSFTPDDPDDVIVAQIDPPLSGPGSVGSDQFAFFRGTFHVPGTLDLHRGTYLEVELTANALPLSKMSVGPLTSSGSPQAQINYLALDSCLTCGDLNGSGDFTEIDYLRLLASYGQATTAGSAAGTCMDLTTNGYVDLGDLMMLDLALQDPGSWGDLCPSTSAPLGLPPAPEPPSLQSLTTTGALHIAGKESESTQNDYLYSVVPAGVSVDTSGVTSIGGDVCPAGDPQQWPGAGLEDSRGNGPLVRANNGDLYQVNPVEGLYRLTSGGSESRSLELRSCYSPPSDCTAPITGGGTLRVGVQFPSGVRTGVPISDAAVRVSGANTYVWLVPVVVTPPSGSAYVAAAKLLLTGGGNWSVVRLYGQSGGPQNLREIEVSGGLVLVSGSGGGGDDRVIIYDEDGASAAPRTSVRLADLFSAPADAPRDPAGLLLVEDRLYLAAAATSTGGAGRRVYRFKLVGSPTLCDVSLGSDGWVDVGQPTLSNPYNSNPIAMHLVSLAKHPTTNEIWALGFATPTFGPNNSLPSVADLFTTPVLAIVRPAWFTSPPSSPTAAALSCHDLAFPTSMVFHDGAAPRISSWRSVGSHSGACALPIALNSTATGNGAGGPAVEPRSGGIQRIEVDFDQPVSVTGAISVTGRQTVGGVLQSPASYSPASASMADADTLAITFAEGTLPDEACYTIDLSVSVQNTNGTALTGDTNCSIRSLVGDSNGSGDVNLSDALFAQARSGAAASSIPWCDLNLSGAVDLSDALLAKSRVLRPPAQALCP